MSTVWSAGTFLGKARELRRRLGYWHVEDPEIPRLHDPSVTIPSRTHYSPRTTPLDCVGFWEGVSFRDELPETDDWDRPRMYGCAEDKDGILRQYPNACEEIHRPVTLWQLWNFHRQLKQAETDPALDCLRVAIDCILDRPAWLVGRSFPSPNQGQAYCVVDGRPVPEELLNNLLAAAERLFDQGPGQELTQLDHAVLMIIQKASQQGTGIQDKHIVKELENQGLELKETTLRRHVLRK